MHQRIVTVLAILFGLSTAVFGGLYFQKETNSLPQLPFPSNLTGTQRETADASSAPVADSLLYPYYGTPQYNYIFSLDTAFPAVGETLPVYTVTPVAYDRDAAIALAATLGFADAPVENEGSFTFTRGLTPNSGTKLLEGSSGSSSAGVANSNETTVEPSEPTPDTPPADQTYTGKELTITTEGYITYTDYALTQMVITAVYDTTTTDRTELQAQFPEGITDSAQAIKAAVDFLGVLGLRPATYETQTSDPYGTYPVTITPTRDGYPIQPGAISIQVGDGGAVASLSMRAVTTSIFSPYPIKAQNEVLSLPTLEYRITAVSILYVSSYTDDGAEFVQPVYVLTGTDSLGNAFTFEIPAVKAEFLQQNKVLPLREGIPADL